MHRNESTSFIYKKKNKEDNLYFRLSQLQYLNGTVQTQVLATKEQKAKARVAATTQ